MYTHAEPSREGRGDEGTVDPRPPVWGVRCATNTDISYSLRAAPNFLLVPRPQQSSQPSLCVCVHACICAHTKAAGAHTYIYTQTILHVVMKNKTIGHNQGSGDMYRLVIHITVTRWWTKLTPGRLGNELIKLCQVGNACVSKNTCRGALSARKKPFKGPLMRRLVNRFAFVALR